MQRMIDLIRKSAVSATIMQAAARGALAVPPEEVIEILVHLANHNKVFGAQARMTLAGWDEKSSLAAAANAKTSAEVLRYLSAEENLRPKLLPALLENPSVPEEGLVKLARTGSREIVAAMKASARVKTSPKVWRSLQENPNFSLPVGFDANAPDSSAATTVNENAGLDKPASEAEVPDSALDTEGEDGGTSEQVEQAASVDDLDGYVSAFMQEHAQEIAAEGEKPFQPIGGAEGLAGPPAAEPVSTLAGSASAAAQPAQTHKAAFHPHARPQDSARRDSTLQKIAKLDIKGRIQLAMKGNKEERSILIRDGTKIVALAVLDSPKVTDGEVEGFASQKNVLEAVLRGIPMKRRYAKLYPVVRNLVFNPRTPLDLSLGLMKNLLVNDLKNLSSNKEVSDTIRKLAMKMFKQKLDAGKKKGD
ncbi:MAG TPA: hypothetical protein VFI95_25005 [Terriglobales bacterium]|nr:hypothetical protein [Terriglobales bacterium]